MVKYVSLSFPVELKELVLSAIKQHPEWGYASVSEFMKDSVRDKLVKLRYIGK